jgi:hypothetical protein
LLVLFPSTADILASSSIQTRMQNIPFFIFFPPLLHLSIVFSFKNISEKQ